MESEGFLLDVTECNRQIAMLEERIQWVDKAILPLIPAKPKPFGATINKVYKINGTYTKQILDWVNDPENQVRDPAMGAMERGTVAPSCVASSVSHDYTTAERALTYDRKILEYDSKSLPDGEVDGGSRRLDTESSERAEVAGPFNRIEFVPINLDSSKQVNEWLLANGWKPKVWNYQKDKSGKELKDYYGNKIKTSPKITEDSFQDLEELGAAGALIAYRRKCTHKRNRIQGFLRHQRKDGTIPSVVNTIGAATGRMTHSVVANVPAPKQKAFWKWMRKVFTAPKGYLVVGADADQCQVRALAHYMDSSEFTEYLLDPNVDLHSVNAERAGVTRSHAKNVFYGYLFGAGANKTASQIGCTVQEAEEIRKKFEAAVPEIPKLIAALKKFWDKNGYILGIDGRKIYVPYEHMLLVYLLQNFEAVLMKWAMVLVDEAIKDQGLDARFATFQHDEFQTIVREDHAERVAKILEDSINQAGTILGSRCEIKGKADMGMTWYDTH